MYKERLLSLSKDFSTESIQLYFQLACEDFTPSNSTFDPKNDAFSKATILGTIEFSGSTDRLTVVSMQLSGNVHEQHRKSQFEEIKHFTSNHHTDAVLAVFYDEKGRARVSLVHPRYAGAKRSWNNWRRDTFYIDPSLPNKTFVQQLQNCQYRSLNEIREAFSVTKVSEEFYKEFIGHFNQLEKSVSGTNDTDQKQEFALLLVIRLIFIAFIQKRGWLGDDQKFLQHFKQEYLGNTANNKFYKDWLSILLFDSLSQPIGSYITSDKISSETKIKLQMAPYLNGGLFERISGIDNQSLDIPDKPVLDFLDFLFSYNITVQENELYDEELELNPEFLGIIFERYINKDGGAVYTPRTEVDFMCRMSLLKWLQGVLPEDSNIETRDLYELFFREGGASVVYEEDQKKGSFSPRQESIIADVVSTVTICDPAVGSGAFPVGMLHVIDEVLTTLGGKPTQSERYERKKKVIEKTLYGMEVQKWAVWICYLRLWLTLFIDAPDELKTSLEPILPSLEFKVLQGDSIVQTIGKHLMPIDGHIATSSALKTQLTKLKQLKSDYFNNRASAQIKPAMIRSQEIHLARSIIQQERQAKVHELAALRQTPLITQESLLGDEGLVTQQSFGETEEKAYLDEIAEIDSMLSELSNHPKTIWSISFAEVFADKGGFDIIIGNPPYVRQEEIADLTGTFNDPKFYKQKLAEVIAQDYWPTINDFGVFKKRSGYNAKSDLYVYFYLHTLKLLNPNGIHTFICSNSWLDVGYGAWLQKFLLDKVQVHAIYDNHAKRSFASADVNTIISILGAPNKKPSNQYKFVAFKKSFEEAIITENLLEIEQADGIHKQDAFRVYPIKPQKLLSEGTEDGKYAGGKWGGMYLRAPDVLFEVIERADGKLTKLKKLAEVIPGCYSGINDFFYINKETVDEYAIEPEYLLPLLRNTRSIRSLNFSNNNKDYVLAIPPIPKNQLRPNVRRYTEWGETQTTRKRQKTKAGIPWPKTATMSNRHYWYSIPEKNLLPTRVFMQYVVGDKFCAPFSQEAIVSDRCYHRIFPHRETDELGLAASLNSTITHLFIMIGRSGLGQGALKFETSDAKLINLYYPSSQQTLDSLKELIPELGKRLPQSAFIECGIDPESEVPIEDQDPKPLADRAAIDKIIFDDLGLSSEERKDVYRAVCRLVHNRLSKANSV